MLNPDNGRIREIPEFCRVTTQLRPSPCWKIHHFRSQPGNGQTTCGEQAEYASSPTIVAQAGILPAAMSCPTLLAPQRTESWLAPTHAWNILRPEMINFPTWGGPESNVPLIRSRGDSDGLVTAGIHLSDEWRTQKRHVPSPIKKD